MNISKGSNFAIIYLKNAYNLIQISTFLGPSGPFCNGLYGVSAVTNPRRNGVIVIGPRPMNGPDYSLHELACPSNENGCRWITLPQMIKQRGSGHASFLVFDNENFNCTNI